MGKKRVHTEPKEKKLALSPASPQVLGEVIKVEATTLNTPPLTQHGWHPCHLLHLPHSMPCMSALTAVFRSWVR